jgi:hypothetical protein
MLFISQAQNSPSFNTDLADFGLTQDDWLDIMEIHADAHEKIIFREYQEKAMVGKLESYHDLIYP